ncbi:hypothetical protein MTR_5g090315 [Medicago truncatula]|uniref:AAA ATPase AAA+ lid domain-containing protein n=1 Tax=Medicago truncatula TaxID=3880 RepID=A0A072UFE9_MEDTR|nr:hypothetical protein MTR_5g090315 [Medicago truncatula]
MEDCENFSGADLAALMEEAGLAAIIEKQTSTEKTSGTIKTCYFEVALSKVSPSVSKMQIENYERFSKGLKQQYEKQHHHSNDLCCSLTV